MNEILQCPDHKVNLLKLDESFRSAWNVWLSTSVKQKEEVALTLDDCLSSKTEEEAER